MVPYVWEGNVGMAMRHRRQWFIHLRAKWLIEGREAPRLHSYNEYGTALPLPIEWLHLR